MRRRGRRALFRAIVAVLVLVPLIAAPAAFVRTQCYRVDGPTARMPGNMVAAAAQIRGYERDEARTYLSAPEWLIVYSTAEHAAFIEHERPSAFPYFRSIVQYWTAYRAVCGATRSAYPFDSGLHLMLTANGVSFTIANALKGLYEGSVGRVTEWVGTSETAEDRWAQRTEREYAAFMEQAPWHQFPFLPRLTTLWTDVPWWGEHPTRKFERRAALTLEYSFKTLAGWAIGHGSASVAAPGKAATYARVRDRANATASDKEIRRVAAADDGSWVVALPRDEDFTPAAMRLLGKGSVFVDVAGNDRMLITVLAPADAVPHFPPDVRVVFRLPMLTRPSWERIALDVPVASLQLAAELRARHVEVEHFYDY